MNLTRSRLWALLAALMLPAVTAAPSANAHPHVWVAVEATVVYDKGSIKGLKHRWTFDELYTSMAIQGLDTNKDGKYSREELSELAKVNIEGLKEFGYFTYARLGTAELKLAEPVDVWLDYDNGALALNFMLPLDKQVLAEADGFNFVVTDPSFFIAFDLAKDKPVQLADAPSGCVARVAEPEKDDADAKRLGEAFQQQLGGNALGLGTARTVSVSCPRS